jgi:hypothetical protein
MTFGSWFAQFSGMESESAREFGQFPRTIRIEEVSMPNQKSRKKKDGTNKSKKIQAMRQKERSARPRSKPSATGQGIGERLKDQTVQDRPGNMSRA